MRALIVTADDFGLTHGVNEAVSRAATSGILTTASLMVSGPAAADAVERARKLPSLAVGLHLVVIEGAPTLPPETIPDLVNASGRFPSNQFRLGMNYFFRPSVRRQLAAEIRAQFEAFRATGLVLDHANAHKHMHLHPTVGRLLIGIGREYGLNALRVPSETPFDGGPVGGLDDILVRRWTKLLRCQASQAGLLCNDHIVGLGWSGHMTTPRVNTALPHLHNGLTEMYFHPATRADAVLTSLMPGYEHVAEFEALMTARVPPDAELTTFGARLKQAWC